MTKEYGYCPKCKSQNISAQEFDPDMYFREVHCLKCNFFWHEQFTLSGNFDHEWTMLEEPK